MRCQRAAPHRARRCAPPLSHQRAWLSFRRDTGAAPCLRINNNAALRAVAANTMGSGSTPLQGRGLRRLPSVCGRAPEGNRGKRPPPANRRPPSTPAAAHHPTAAVAACPAEPAGRPSLRTISLARDEFEKQAASTSSLWRVSINARAGGEGSAPRCERAASWACLHCVTLRFVGPTAKHVALASLICRCRG